MKDILLGNYTIKLTVKDAEGLIDTTTSSLTVLKENDYPPTAIAGEDKIVFLPQVTQYVIYIMYLARLIEIL